MENNLVYTTPSNFVSYMFTHPQRWKDYVTKCAFTPKTPFDQETPWISLPAIEQLEKRIKPGTKVLEFGGGGSTLYFANKKADVTCIESDRSWIQNLQKKIAEKGHTNVKVLYRNFRVQPEAEFRKSEYMVALPGETYDIILVDGPEIEGYKARPVCFEWAEKNINKGGIIIVDDAWRYPQLHKNNHAKSYKEFEGIGPGRKGITKTDIYFY